MDKTTPTTPTSATHATHATGITDQTNQTTQSYSVREMTHHDIPAMLAVQEDVNSPHVIPRDAAYLQAHFKAGHKAIGIFDGENLAAQATITIRAENTSRAPQSFRALFADKALSGGTIGFMMTHPAYRGHGLNKQLVRAAIAILTAQGHDFIQARVRVENEHCAAGSFLKQGFTIAGEGQSPDSPAHKVWTYQKPLTARAAALAGQTLAADNHAKNQAVMTENHCAVRPRCA